MISGVQHTRRGFKTKAEAKEWEARQRSTFTTRPDGSASLIDICVKYLRYSERFSQKTIQKKTYLCRRILAEFGNGIDLESITPEMVQSFLDARAASKSSNASNEDRKHLLAMFNFSQKILGISHNPMAFIRPRPHDVAPQYTPHEAEVTRLLDAATPEERNFLTCYLATGARRSEIFRLTWEDVNFESGTIRLGTRKTRDGSMKYRTLPMNTQLKKTLLDMFLDLPDQRAKSIYVFTNPITGDPYVVRRRFIKGLCKRAGIPPFGFHALRRYVASILSDKHKISSKAIQTVLGHESQATTERYLHKIHTGMPEIMELLTDGTNAGTKSI